MNSPKRPPLGTPKKSKTPATVEPAKRLDRQKGALWGLALGDALGVTLQDKRLPAPDFPDLAEGLHTEMKGSTSKSLRPGQVSRPTQLAVCLASVLKNQNTYDAAEALKAYRKWAKDYKPLGPQLEPLFQAYDAGLFRPTAAIRHWVAQRPTSHGNVSLGRTGPLGVFFSQRAAERLAASMEDSALTHFHPLCQLACVFVNAAVATAIESVEDATVEAMLEASQQELRKAGAALSREYPEFSIHIQEAAEQLLEDCAWAQKPDPQLYGPDLFIHSMAEHVRVTFRLALWELVHAHSGEAALIDVVNRGGDTSTNGAVTGLLLGARFGMGTFPERWVETVRDSLSTAYPRTSAWTHYHPRHLLQLVEPKTAEEDYTKTWYQG